MSNNLVNIDNPEKNDNRYYDFSNEDFYSRAEFPVITDWLSVGNKIIDLGCGNGSLMKYLKENKNVEIEGIEIAPSGVDFCLRQGLNARQGEIDKANTYIEYTDKQFDFAICNVTLQMVQYPEVLLKEMIRISRQQIISFPNFAYFENRLQLLFKGVMPKKMLFGYNWYNTGHIHQLSLKDFTNFCKNNNMEIIKVYHLGCFRKIANLIWPNLFSKESIFLCKSK
jgi:methionine biosynthesis protein MetW